VRSRFSTRATVRWTQYLESRGEEAHVAGLEFESVVEALVGRSGDSALLDVFLTLRVAVAQLRLYSKESPQVLKVVTDTYHSIHSFLENAGTLTMSRTPRGLLVNGRPLQSAGTVTESLEASMLALLTDAQVKSITFRKGLGLDELITFLHALTRKFWDVKDGKEINKRLRDERVLQVTVDEVQYVALGEGDIVIEDAARKISGGETELASILNNLDQMLDTGAQESLASEVRMNLLKRLLDKDPNLLRKAREGNMGLGGLLGGEGEGGGPAAPRSDEGRIALEQAREAVADLAHLLRETPEELRPALRRVGKAIAQAFAHAPAVVAMIDGALSEAASKGKASAAPAAAADPPAVARGKAVLSMNDDDRLQAMSQEGAGLMDELAALGQLPLLQALLGGVSALLLDRLPRRRLSAARALNSFRRGLERNVPEAVFEEFERGVLQALEMERDGNVYSVLADITAFLADLRIRKARIDRTRECLELLHKHYHIKDPSFTQRGELAYIALERVASGVGFASIAEKVRSGDPETTRLLESLGAAATRFLIREIKSADSPARRMHFAQFILRAGAGAATVIVDEIQKTTSPSDVLHLIEVMPHAMPRDMAEMSLGGLLRHGSVAVRRRAAQALAEHGYLRGGGLVMDAFEAEADAPTRLAYLDCVGKLRHRGAVDRLLEIVEARSQPDELREAACQALGRIGDDRAVPVLAKLYFKGEKGLTKMLRLVPQGVRSAAARALASFPAHPEAREALKRAKEDHDPALRAVANQALYAPLQEAFGEMALGVQLISDADEIGPRNLKIGGALEEVTAADALRALAGAEATGALFLSFRGTPARIWLDAGLVIAAELEGRRDQEAFYEAVRRPEGYFVFRAGERAAARRILKPVDALIEEASRAPSVPLRPDSNAGRPPSGTVR
jgi:hypothetical protein